MPSHLSRNVVIQDDGKSSDQCLCNCPRSSLRGYKLYRSVTAETDRMKGKEAEYNQNLLLLLCSRKLPSISASGSQILSPIEAQKLENHAMNNKMKQMSLVRDIENYFNWDFPLHGL